jgi:hypothetical protein
VQVTWQADEVELVVRPCLSLCQWVRTRADEDLFACQGCGSQWRPGAGWTPVDADGHVPAEVRHALLTSVRPAAGAGRADSSTTTGS